MTLIVLQDYTVSIMLSLSWNITKTYESQYKDVDYFEIDTENMKKLWIPDLYFPNEKRASYHRVMSSNTGMKYYPDGMIDYSAR